MGSGTEASSASATSRSSVRRRSSAIAVVSRAHLSPHWRSTSATVTIVSPMRAAGSSGSRFPAAANATPAAAISSVVTAAASNP